MVHEHGRVQRFMDIGKAKEMLFLMYSADTPAERVFQNTMVCLYNACLISKTLVLFPRPSFFHLFLTELNVNESFNFICKPDQDKSVNLKRVHLLTIFFKILKTWNLWRQLIKFCKLKKQLQDYRCNLLIKLHSSNQGISPVKYFPRKHLILLNEWLSAQLLLTVY